MHPAPGRGRELKRNSRLGNHLVTLLTLGTIFPVLFIRLIDLQSSLFWAYSVSMTLLLLFMYTTTNNYQPQPDLGYRPRVTVLIPAKNEQDAIEPVVRAVLNSDYPQSKLDLVAIDDGSTDKTWDNLQRVKRDPELSPRLQLVRHEVNYGKRVALASGSLHARGEILVCIDSDSFVDRNAIKNLVQPFQDPHTVAVCGHGQAANLNHGLLVKLQHYWYQEMFRLWKGMESRFGSVTCCSGILSAYRKTSVQPLLNQWLLERFPDRQPLASDPGPGFSLKGPLTRRLIKSPGEDRVLTAYALSGKNARVVYQSNALVHTIVPGTFKQFLRQQLRWARAWVHSSFLEGRFMWKKPVPIALIYYLYQFLAYLIPPIVITWFLIKPLQGDLIGPTAFLLGTMYVGVLHGVNCWKHLRTPVKAIPYRAAFVFISLCLAITVSLYGWCTPWKGGWLTRQTPISHPSVPEPVPVEPVLTPGLPA